MNQYNSYPPGFDPRGQMGNPRPNNPGFDPTQSGWRPYVPEPQPVMIPVQGRWVDNHDEILPKEVPMDGNLYFFPQSDRSCIYAKIWTNDGQLRTFRFLPEKNEPPAGNQQPSDYVQQTLTGFASAIDQRLAAFEQRLNDVLVPFQQTEATLISQVSTTTPRSKKVKETANEQS